MKPFKFTLQALHTLRQRAENQALEAYATSLVDRARAAASLAACEQELDAAQATWQQQVQSGCLAVHLARLASHREILATRRDEKLTLLGAAERRVNFALKEMLAARQQREAVEQLLARQRRNHKAAVDRDEQKFLDELAQRRPEGSLTAGFEPMAL
jgi:flagellar export protein FliJ